MNDMKMTQLMRYGKLADHRFSGWRATYERATTHEKEENMNQRLILIVTLIVITVIALLTQRHTTHSATFAAPLPAAPAKFAASTDKTFDQ